MSFVLGAVEHNKERKKNKYNYLGNVEGKKHAFIVDTRLCFKTSDYLQILSKYLITVLESMRFFHL